LRVHSGKGIKSRSEINQECLLYGADRDHIDYVKGANIGGFIKVADVMLAYGIM
jgi:glutamate dehydrogenase (NADP+)